MNNVNEGRETEARVAGVIQEGQLRVVVGGLRGAIKSVSCKCGLGVGIKKMWGASVGGAHSSD